VSKRYSNPDLTVGADNKQRWNQPAHRRHGFHQAHRLFRRAAMVRARQVLALKADDDRRLAAIPEVARLLADPAFSALACVRGERILLQTHAADFGLHQPHSMQSISKLHMHLMIGQLRRQGLIDLDQTIDHYLPQIGSAYAKTRLQDALDMNIRNGFSEDYDDPLSDCYREEVALGWRLPGRGEAEFGLADFLNSLGGNGRSGGGQFADYKSANTDVLTLICRQVRGQSLLTDLEAIADAAGYAGSFHISMSRDQLPALSGGGCLSVLDLARFGLLFTRADSGDRETAAVVCPDFLTTSLHRPAPRLAPPKDWLRYSNHLMTNGRWLGHAGYGGQFLLVDLETGVVCAFYSVLENPSGYDSAYMAEVLTALVALCRHAK
jgi:CubicO group peptidase (beta-lactamase class C family)